MSDPVELKELRGELRHLLTGHPIPQKPSTLQLHVIEMVALGLKNREIAENLGTTEQVVKNHLHKIYATIRVQNQIRLALWYEEQGHEGKLARHPDLLSRP